MQHFVRRTTLVAVAALLAGCSLSSSTPSTPGASNPAPLTKSLAARPDRTSAIYSSHVAFAGPDGRHYAGDAVVFPKELFSGLRVPGLANAGRGAVPNVIGALSYYLGVPGVKGGDPGPGSYENWIDVDAFSIGYGPAGVGKTPVTDLSIDKGIDIASPLLLGSVVGNAPFRGSVPGGTDNVMELDVAQTNQDTGKQQKIMYFTFTKALGTSFASSYADAADGVTETVTIAYQSATFCVIPVNAAGKPQTPVCNVWTPTAAR